MQPNRGNWNYIFLHQKWDFYQTKWKYEQAK